MSEPAPLVGVLVGSAAEPHHAAGHRDPGESSSLPHEIA